MNAVKNYHIITLLYLNTFIPSTDRFTNRLVDRWVVDSLMVGMQIDVIRWVARLTDGYSVYSSKMSR